LVEDLRRSQTCCLGQTSPQKVEDLAEVMVIKRLGMQLEELLS
jgi:hypothetical protein